MTLWSPSVAAGSPRSRSPDGGVPTVFPTGAGLSARAVDGAQAAKASGCLTYALAAKLWRLRLVPTPVSWREPPTWCWAQLDAIENPRRLHRQVRREFLDAVPDPTRAAAAVERLREGLRPRRPVAVPEGVESETIRPLDLSPRPGASAGHCSATSRSGRAHQARGGPARGRRLDVDFLHLSPGQSVEWRGMATLGALATLHTHGCIELPRSSSRLPIRLAATAMR